MYICSQGDKWQAMVDNYPFYWYFAFFRTWGHVQYNESNFVEKLLRKYQSGDTTPSIPKQGETINTMMNCICDLGKIYWTLKFKVH